MTVAGKTLRSVRQRYRPLEAVGGGRDCWGSNALEGGNRPIGCLKQRNQSFCMKLGDLKSYPVSESQ